MKPIQVLTVSCAFLVAASTAALAAQTNAKERVTAKPAHHAVKPVEHGDATTALNLLEANGYHNFTNFRPDDKKFAATVTQNGVTKTVMIDPAGHSVQAMK